MEDCYTALTPMAANLKITDEPINGNSMVDDYISLVGSLQFLATYTRPDIAFATSFLARRNNSPTPQCWEAAKTVLHYLKKIIDYRIVSIITGKCSEKEGMI